MPPLRVMTYNVRYFGHGTRGLASTRGGIVRIARALAALDPSPEVICLQEVETSSLRSNILRRPLAEQTQLDHLVHELDAALAIAGRRERFIAYYFPAHAYRVTERTSVYTTGLAVLARIELEVMHHNAGRPHDITHRRALGNLKQTRVCGHVAFRAADGQTLDVFNTHLSLPNFWSKRFWTDPLRMGFGDNQLAEARALSDFVSAEKRGEHVLIMGDFNSLPGSPVDRFLREERGYTDGLCSALCLEERAARDFATAGFLNLRMHLDHIYASPSLRLIDVTGTTPFGKPGPFAGLSDHVPILARISPR